MSIHLDSVSTRPCFILYIVSKRDQANYFSLSGYPFVAFSALTLLVGRQEGHPACKTLEWWGSGVVICLERDADLHTA